MFEDGIVRKKQIGFDPETSMYCFGGGGGNNSTSDSAYSNQQVGQGSKTSQPGKNTRIDSRGNTVNFNTAPATVTSTPNYTKTLPNGVVVEDFSRPFAGQVNLSNRGTPEVTDLSTNLNRGLYDNLAVNIPTVTTGRTVSRPELGAVSNVMDTINRPTTPQEAMQQALGAGQFGDGRMGLGGGFSIGKVPGGFGFRFDRAFAQGGPVTAGIGSLGLPQAMFKSTKS